VGPLGGGLWARTDADASNRTEQVKSEVQFVVFIVDQGLFPALS
jgi:hypothetical protein